MSVPIDQLPEKGTITGLSPATDSPLHRDVLVDGRLVARLPAEEVQRLGLDVGAAWTAPMASAVRASLARAAARHDALKILGRVALTRSQLVQRLGRLGHLEDAVEAIAAECVQAGWINDEAQARSICRQILRRGPAGERLLVEGMTRKGIDPVLASRAAREALEQVDPLESALAVARRRAASLGRVAPVSARRRIAGALARRGFDEETIAAVIERLDEEDDSQDVDDHQRDP
jgi:regulatory protein